MAARRCSDCAINWPIGDDYKLCSRCLSDTDYISNGDSLTHREAESLTKRLKFDRFYAEHDERRKPERLRPDGEALETARAFKRTLVEIHALPETPELSR